MEPVNVVVGIIVKGNKFLVERRRMDKKVDPRIICLPAGHVEPNEDLEDALKREMLEELDIQVKQMTFVCKNYYVASNGEKQHAYCYKIIDYEGKLESIEAAEIFWEEDLNKMTLDIDKETIRKMQQLTD